MIGPALRRSPLIVAIAGPNGAGKTTFFNAYVQRMGLRFVNADDIARTLNITAYEAAEIAGALRRDLVKQRESFAFETVFSDEVGDKLSFLSAAAASGYHAVLYFIAISSPEASMGRVEMRVSKGGHDVPTGKLISRFPRTMANLKAAIRTLPIVRIYDNDDLANPFRKIAEYRNGNLHSRADAIPDYLRHIFG